jgi:TRAP transporter 4TM/12TM fusion protein
MLAPLPDVRWRRLPLRLIEGDAVTKDNLKSTNDPAPADLEAAQAFVEEEEGKTHRVKGALSWFLPGAAILSTLFHLYAAYDVVPTHVLRPAHVGIILCLTFLMLPIAPRFRDSIRWWDWLLAAGAVATIGYVLWHGADFGDNAIIPSQLDVVVGVALIVLILEAARRTTGIIMPIICLVFLLYAMFGNHLPAPWTHRGYGIDRLIGQLYMTLEGIFGSAVDVSSSLIILFSIFGAILARSGAGKFFIDFSFAAMGGKRNAAGRAVVMSSFLMGGPSGSGVATTVTIGAVAHPMLTKAGYDRNAAGGLLAAGGLGAIISPPVLGAAAFLIAEFLKIPYIDVIWMALIPTFLYYFGILVMVEIDARKYGGANTSMGYASQSLWQLTKDYWFHFGSLVSIVVFMMLGYSPILSVFYATLLAIAVSFLRRDTALMPDRLSKALAEGTTGVLNVAPTCAAAGIIVGVVTLTGLAQRFADIIITYAAGSLLLTAIYTSAIVWVVGLAVPVTASYILCAVIAAPALIKLGVPDFAAHMFIFYYAVLSEVSPPTALSPFAAAAITGGDPYKTTLQSWKYTMPAFLAPFIFVIDPLGTGLLMKIPKGGSMADIMVITAAAACGIAALGAAFQGWLRQRLTGLERGLFLLSGILFVLPKVIDLITQPLLGIDVDGLIAGPGFRFGVNIPLGMIVGVLALVLHMKRTRPLPTHLSA